MVSKSLTNLGSLRDIVFDSLLSASRRPPKVGIDPNVRRIKLSVQVSLREVVNVWLF